MRRAIVDEVIMRLASGQHGVVARAQLLEAGVSADQLDRRLQFRWLRQLWRGVYVVGPVVAPYGKEMAAVLACGRAAFLSHCSAGVLWVVIPPLAESIPLDVTITRGNRGHRPNLRVHRFRTLRADEVTELHGIPLTTPARTLLDLAGILTHRELEQAVAEAVARCLTTRAAMLALLARHPRRRGTDRLRAMFADEAQPAWTRSEAEELFLDLVRKAKLGRPEVNVPVEGHRVDFFWRTERLVVEIDGFAFHRTRRSFEQDRLRDAVLAAAGVRVMRVTWQQMVSEPEAMLIRVALALNCARNA